MTKTLIMWRRKGTRTYKQLGTATADGSAATIYTMWRAAAAGDGTLAIVDASSASAARETIRVYLNSAPRITDDGAARSGVIGRYLDGRAFALGARAILAIAGASEAVRHWDSRLAHDGRVRVKDTTALGSRSDGASFTTLDAFGDGFDAVNKR